MNPLITELRSSLPCTDLTAKGDDISSVNFQVGIVPSTKTVSTSFIYYSFRSNFNNFWEFYPSINFCNASLAIKEGQYILHIL